MDERTVAQVHLFCEFSLERHNPADHLLRSNDRSAELYMIEFKSKNGRRTRART